MINSISDFTRFKYRLDNFSDIRDYCEDNDIWLCQSLRKSGDMTFGLARNEEVAAKLNSKFG